MDRHFSYEIVDRNNKPYKEAKQMKRSEAETLSILLNKMGGNDERAPFRVVELNFNEL
jgi:hypothetical protein